MAEKITDTLVKSVETPTKGNRITYDMEIKGFGIRVTSGGAKSFFRNYWVGAVIIASQKGKGAEAHQLKRG